MKKIIFSALTILFLGTGCSASLGVGTGVGFGFGANKSKSGVEIGVGTSKTLKNSKQTKQVNPEETKTEDIKKENINNSTELNEDYKEAQNRVKQIREDAPVQRVKQVRN